MSNIVEKLTENIVARDLQKEGAALLTKWEKTGLLEGISNDNQKNTLSVLLENQAKELLREASTMANGDVEGFAAVAFPIVRRVFGSLLANDIVSVQPMALPSGLIFFLDFQTTFHKNLHQGADPADDTSGDSVYGGGIVAAQITGGVNDVKETGGGMYNLANAYASPTGSVALGDAENTAILSFSDNECGDKDATGGILATPVAIGSLTEAQKKALRFDPDLLADTSTNKVACHPVRLSQANMDLVNLDALPMCNLTNDDTTPLSDGGGDLTVLRRLTEKGVRNSDGNIIAGTKQQYISFYSVGGSSSDNNIAATATFQFPRKDAFAASGTPGAITTAGTWHLEANSNTDEDGIPEIDIKVESVSVTAVTKKLKAKWSPELAQDLNAYHNLDAEVELTSILSEQIALEIDREILGDLIKGATAGTLYWSRSPGLFVNRETGVEVGATSASPDFTGTVSEWYETLIETINDVSARIHKKTLRGGANFVVCSPEVASILEFTAGFRASVTVDQDGAGSIGAQKAGSLSKKFDVYVDPYFPRNVVLVGRKGSSFLESGFVYAPYVPLQVTPTIFGVEDFVPRKGVMTRYGKKMVRPDMYGLVICRGLLGEAGG
tara:strand:+ start:937 stop:2769 length:1833 start_codon:yes stop_codon:yes gene_type:complete